MNKIKIYMDSCCLNRPYDDLSTDMVQMEAEAIILIIDKCESGAWTLYTSDVLFDEIDNIPNFIKKRNVLMLYQSAKNHIDLTPEIVARARELETFNIKPYDALHLASAEIEHIDIFLTTDRKFLNAACRSDAKVRVMNPLIWITEVLYNGY